MSFVWASVVGLLVSVVVAVLAAVTRDRTSQRRRAALAAWAQRNELTYEPAVPALALNWPGPPFNGDTAGRAVDVLSGLTLHGRPFCAFTYRSDKSFGRGWDNDVATQTVIALRLPAMMPELAVTAEGFVAKAAKALGGQDVEVGDHEFDKAYRVQASDESFARDVLCPPVTRLLVRKGWEMTPWRISGADLLCWQEGKLDRDRLLPQLELMTEVFETIPEHVWTSYGRALPPGRELR